MAGAPQRPPSTSGIPLPFTGWRTYFWDPRSWPAGAGIQKGQLALRFSNPKGLRVWECRDTAAILMSQLGEERKESMCLSAWARQASGDSDGPCFRKVP